MNSITKNFLFKIIIVGPAGVGKSSLLLKYTKDEFERDYNVTIGVDFASKCVEIPTNNNQIKSVKLQLWDTAGQEKFKTITKSYYRGCSGGIIVFDVTNRESYENIDNWIKTIREECAIDTTIILVGNKIDKTEREVTYKEASSYAENIGLKYFETSAKELDSTGVAFNILAQDILNKTIEVYPNLPTGVREYDNPYNQSMNISLDKPLRKNRVKNKCCIK